MSEIKPGDMVRVTLTTRTENAAVHPGNGLQIHRVGILMKIIEDYEPSPNWDKEPWAEVMIEGRLHHYPIGKVQLLEGDETRFQWFGKSRSLVQ